MTYYLTTTYQQAIEYYQQALTISRQIGNKSVVGLSLGNLGIAYRNLGQYQQAINYYQQALLIAEDIGDIRGQGNRFNNLGVVYESLEDYERAIEYHQQALAIFEQLGVPHLIEKSKRNLADAQRKLAEQQGNAGDES
ncbi:MAG: tetratricopeptide repeat protein [Chloroflexota bacterium]